MNVVKRLIYLTPQYFKHLSLGKKLVLILIIKLFIMFIVLKLFFFPDFLKTKFNSDKERSEYVIEQLTKNTKK